ncbi:putative RuBisCO transcriptional regulator [Erwinia amylovora Ea644]|uniref:LysR family transcriptional regulator n=1 Tax=Erwinia amylovora TaxID=552 RepID=UPI0002CCBD59|nr:LysR family transcriptional regulator [Erwinia amylovora]CCP04554.1 putative RuBisCO transcriptional regulator [Erwinia amylovora Ea644]
MSVSEDRLRGITPFVASVESGSFTAAAGRLHLTCSAVSKSIARLEARLGSRLFERTTRSLVLTDAGQAFYDTCARVLGELAEAESVLAARRSMPVGRLRVAVPHTFGRLHVMPLLNDFCRQHPEMQLNMSFSDRFVDLFEEGIDVAVRIGGPGNYPPSLGVRYLGSERLIFCAAPDYLAQHGMPQSLAQLEQHKAIVYNHIDGSTSPWHVASLDGRITTRTVAHRMALADGEAQRSAVAAGLGVAQMATWLMEQQLAQGELIPILPQLSVAGLPLYVVWPRRKQLMPKVDALLNTLAKLQVE